MGDRIDEKREPENIGEEDELLPRTATHLTNLRQVLNARHPFFGAKSTLTSKVVKMGNKAGYKERQTGRRTTRANSNRIRSYVVNGKVFEGCRGTLKGFHAGNKGGHERVWAFSICVTAEVEVSRWLLKDKSSDNLRE